MITVKVRKLRDTAVVPARESAGAAGADLHASVDMPVTIGPGETALIPTGLSLEIPAGFAGFVLARSGISSKRGLAPANKVGLIDSDYRGELFVPLHNHGRESQIVAPEERIAQLVILPVPDVEYLEADTLTQTARGDGGFGSTGT